MKIFYRPEMSADSGGYSPSAKKPDLVVQDWKGKFGPSSPHPLTAYPAPEFVSDFDPVTVDDIKLVHDSEFVDSIMSLKARNGHGNHSAEVRDTLLWTSGSLYAGCVAALSDGLTCSPTSGFHHANYDDCHGFCTFNGLMVAAAKLMENGQVGRVSIIDFDAHWGDGCVDILKKLPRYGDRIQYVHASDLPDDPEQFIAQIKPTLDGMDGTDLVIYQAGADMHEDDPLGMGTGLSNEQLEERDYEVFSWCNKNAFPICWNFAGGYQRDENGDISKVLDIHRNTLFAARDAFARPLAT